MGTPEPAPEKLPKYMPRAFYVVFLLPLGIWLLVVGALPEISALDPMFRFLRGTCDGIADWLPGCTNLERRASSPRPQPRDFVAMSYAVVLIGFAISVIAGFALGLADRDVAVRRVMTMKRFHSGLMVSLILIATWVIVWHPPTRGWKPHDTSSASSVVVCLIAGLTGGGIYLLVLRRRGILRTPAEWREPPGKFW